MIEKYLDAEELARLMSALAAVLLALVIAALFASIVVPGIRNANKPKTPTAVSPVEMETGWLDLTEFPAERGRVIAPVDPQTLIAPSRALMDRGKELFEANCVQCHGQAGRGDGPAAGTMNPHPRNFTSPDGWTNGYDMPAVYRTLSQGVSGTSMAAFNYLSRRDRMALVHYVQSLGAFAHATASPQAIESLSKELAAPGEKTPNKIPVSLAMVKLEEEFVARPPLLPNTDVLKRVIVDPARAAQVLSESRLWRADLRDLAAAILPDAVHNGFSLRSATLGPSEWRALQGDLAKEVK
jgi:mono/diheme cytochrome c family protein